MVAVVRALLAKTTENGATEAEAMSAAEKARELMDRYQLEIGAAAVEAEGAHKVVLKRSHVKTLTIKERLAASVASFADVKCWLHKATDELTFFGLKSDAELAAWLIVSLEQFVATGALAYIASQPFMEARVRWEAEKAYMLGAVGRINERLATLTRERSAAMAAKTGDGRSLIVLKDDVVERAFASLDLKLRKGGKFATEVKDEKLPATMLKIGISRSVPRGYPAGYRRLRELEPGPWFNSVTPREYHARFMLQLADLDAAKVVEKIERLSEGRNVALLCYESPHDPKAWCHRGQVSAWLMDELGLVVREFGAEAFGWSHPKLYEGVRRSRGRSD
jgi:hypothetical protein